MISKALLLLSLIVCASLGYGAPPRPANDDMANAVDLGSGSSGLLEGTTLGATVETGEPHETNFLAGVWYKWTPSTSGGVVYHIESGTPHMTVFRPFPLPPGTLGTPWTEVARDSDGFNAQAGETYYVGVYPTGEPGPFRVSLVAGPPDNDNFAAAREAVPVDGEAEIHGQTFDTTREPGEPELPGNPGTAWFRWVPDFTGRVEYYLGRGSLNFILPKIAVFRATGPSISDLVLISGANDRPHVVAGNVYYLAAYDSKVPFRLRLSKAPQPPINDNFASALPFPSASAGSVFGFTLGATREPFEPYNEEGLESIWFKWESPITQSLLLADPVYASVRAFELNGTSIADLKPIGQAPQVIKFLAGHIYYFALYNRYGMSGGNTLSLQSPSSSNGSGDSFDAPLPCDLNETGTGEVILEVRGTTFSNDGSAPPGSSGSSWLTLTTPYPGRLIMRPAAENVVCRLYSGTTLADLSLVDPPIVYPGHTYYIGAYAVGSLSRSTKVNVSLAPLSDVIPSNDSFADALPITPETTFLTGAFRYATIEADEPSVSPLDQVATTQTLWWKLQPERDGQFAIGFQPGNVLGRFAVYRGTQLANLERIPVGWDELLLTPVHAGETLYVQMQLSDFPRPGEGAAVRFMPEVTNDKFENAYSLRTDQVFQVSHNVGASQDPGEPSVSASADGRTVWYTWTSAAPGTLYLNKLQGNELRIYRGTDLQSLTEIVEFPIVTHPNERLAIQVDTAEAASGLIGLSYYFIPSPPLVNDSPVNAEWGSGQHVVFGPGYFGEVEPQPADPDLISSEHKTLWWRWASPFTGLAYFTMLPGPGTPQPVAALYEGDYFGGLQLLRHGGPDFYAVQVRAGHLYYLACAVPPYTQGSLRVAGSVDSVTDPFDWLDPINFLDPANLIVNPSFDGLLGLKGWTLSGNGGSTFFGRWAAHGQESFRLSASPASVSQTIAVQSGQTYRLGFACAAVTRNSVLRVTWNGSEIAVVRPSVDTDWLWTNILVKATSSQATVSFDNLAGPTDIDLITVLPGAGEARSPQEIHIDPIADQQFGAGPIDIHAGSTAGLPVSLTVESGPAVLSGNELTLLGPGLVGIRADAPGSAAYFPAAPLRILFVVRPKPQVIDFPALTAITATVSLNASASSGLPVSFQMLSGPAILSGNTLAFTGPGPVTVQAVQNGNQIYEAAPPVVQTFTFSRLPQTVELLVDVPTEQSNSALGSSGSLSALAISGITARVTAVASSGLPVTVTVLSGPATFSDGTLVVTGSGDVTLQGSQAGDNLFQPASTQQVVQFGKKPQTINFPSVPELRIGSDPYALGALSSSGLPVVYEVVSGSAGTVVHGTFVPQKAGTTIIRALQTGNAEYAPAVPVDQAVSVSRNHQEITFPAPILSVGNAATQLTAFASSGLPITYELLSGPATLQQGRIDALAQGEIVLRATQPGDEAFEPAQPVEIHVTIARGYQSIALPTMPVLRLGNAPFHMDWFSSAGLPLQVDLVSGPVTLVNGSLLPTGAGTVELLLSQPGNDNYFPAHPLPFSFAILRRAQVIAFEPPTRLLEGTSIQLEATSTAHLPVSFAVLTGPAVIESGVLRVLATGQVLVRAEQPGDDKVEPAPSIEVTITVTSTPRLGITLQNGALKISPPDGLSGFLLEESTALTGPWLPAQISAEGTVAPDLRKKFFRLRQAL